MSSDDELPPNARALLEAARDCDDPTPTDRRRIDRTLAPKLAALGIAPALLVPAPLAAAPAVASTASAGLGLGAKLALVLVGTSVAAGGVTYVVREHQHAPAPMYAAAHAASPPHANPRPRALADLPAPAMLEVAPPAVVPEAAERAAPAPTQAPHARSTATAASRHAARTPAVVASAPAIEPASGPLPVAPVAVVDDSLREELALIARANNALRLEHASEALSALDEHAQRFAHGVLSDERRGLRVLALCAQAANGAALEARAAFLRDSPNALLAPKVRAACSKDREGAR